PELAASARVPELDGLRKGTRRTASSTPLPVGLRIRRRRDPLDLQSVDAAAVGAHDAEAPLADRHGVAALGKAAEGVHDEAADGVDRIVGELAAEAGVEIGDLGLRLHAEAP